MTNALRKYLAFLRIAAVQARRARGELYGRVVFFVVILGVFSSLWRAVGEAGMPIAVEPKALVWYLAVTEWIVLSAPLVHFDIQEAVRRGDIVCQLGRPVSWVGAVFAQGLGQLVVRSPVLFLTACACAFVFTGWMPSPRVLAIVAPLGLAAAALMTALWVGVGLLAFFIGDTGPVSWIWQKLMFVFGGLLMPIDLYPPVVRSVAPFTPFPSVLSRPAGLVLQGSGAGAVTLALNLLAWAALTALVLTFLFRRAAGALTVNGG
jgi:ABC-2 type transport system permease protein